MCEIIHKTDNPLEAFLVWSSCQDEAKYELLKFANVARDFLDYFYHVSCGDREKEQRLREALDHRITEAEKFARE